MARRLAQFKITNDLVREVLCLPEGSYIVQIAFDSSNPYVIDRWLITVESPDFPELTEGAKPIEICPSFGVDYDAKMPQALFLNWGLPKSE